MNKLRKEWFAEQRFLDIIKIPTLLIATNKRSCGERSPFMPGMDTAHRIRSYDINYIINIRFSKYTRANNVNSNITEHNRIFKIYFV